MMKSFLYIVSIADFIENIDNLEFRWYFDIDYITINNCLANNCNDDYCGCDTIENPKITNNPLFHEDFGNEEFPLDQRKILVSILNQILDKDDFQILICGGYYGEEIDSCQLLPRTKDKILNSDKIKLLLPFI